MLNDKNFPMRENLTIKAGEKHSLCRCWRSAKFPFCDGSHRQYNEETGDNLGPVVITTEIKS